MRLIATAVSAVLITGCATELGNERHAQHAKDQIQMVAIQQQSRVQEAQADASTNAALVQALAEVARANPDHAPAVTVALAVIGVRSQDGADEDAPLVTLQRQQNDALEYVKVLASPILNTATALGVAAITADVQKNASDNAAKVQINDSIQDANIINSVANLGVAATNQVGIEVTGDYYDLQDSATLDQSTSADTDASIDYTLTDEAFVNIGTINENSGNTSGDTDASITSGDSYVDSNNDNSDNSDYSTTDTVP